jgi:alanine dehydrogenase
MNDYALSGAAVGLEEACRKNPVIRTAVNTYDGKLTNANVGEALGYECTDLTGLIG